jgi:hypothetical protein
MVNDRNGRLKVMRIVVRGALLLALMVALPSIAAAQSRHYSGQPAYSAQQNGSGYNRGYSTGRYVPMPKGWIYENDNGGRDGAVVEGDSYPAGTVESDGGSDSRYGESAAPAEGGDSGDWRYGSTTEGESGDDTRYGGTAGTVEGGYDNTDGNTAETVDGGSDERYGSTAETVEGDSDYRYGGTGSGFQEFGSRPAAGYRPSSRYGSTARVRGRVINCYIDRRGRTICR